MYQLLLFQRKMIIKLLEQFRIVFNRTIEWKKYRSEMTIQTKNHNLTYLIDPTNVSRLFVLSFEIENNRTSFSKYSVPNVQMKDLNVLIDGKRFFDTNK